ncbi:MAG: DegT/DnrJ/EryC1/StrS family aminotransferase [Elusimicrobiota bacterium]
MKVDFVDLRAQYRSIQPEVDPAIQKVLESCAFSGGPFVASFEGNFAKAHQAGHCVGVNSGTSALHVALMALGIKHGDEVIVPTNTFFATPEAVSLTGATPVLVDCEPRYYNIDPEKAEAACTERTKAIIAVHLYGQPAGLNAIAAVAARRRILLIEDCAQAHLAEYKGRPVGTRGICGCFSFYPGKNLGAYGEAGAVLTNDPSLAERMRALRDHGALKKYYHTLVGHNYRMEGIQGAVLDVKLRHLQAWTEARRRNAGLYREHLKDIAEVALPEEMPDASHVYHLFVVRVPERDRLISTLKEDGVSTGIHYPVPCHLQEAFSGLRTPPGSCPVAERYAGGILSLPMFPELTEDQIAYVAERIRRFYRR